MSARLDRKPGRGEALHGHAYLRPGGAILTVRGARPRAVGGSHRPSPAQAFAGGRSRARRRLEGRRVGAGEAGGTRRPSRGSSGSRGPAYSASAASAAPPGRRRSSVHGRPPGRKVARGPRAAPRRRVPAPRSPAITTSCTGPRAKSSATRGRSTRWRPAGRRGGSRACSPRALQRGAAREPRQQEQSSAATECLKGARRPRNAARADDQVPAPRLGQEEGPDRSPKFRPMRARARARRRACAARRSPWYSSSSRR
jgi:hypothetical protein